MSDILLPQKRLKHALRTALSVAVALSLSLRFEWSMPYWAGITALIVSQPRLTDSLWKGIMRLSGTWIGALLSVVLVSLFPQNEFMLVFIFSALIILFVYPSKDSPYSYSLILGVGTMITVVTFAVQEPPMVWHFAVYRAANISLGVLVSLAINMLFRSWEGHSLKDIIPQHAKGKPALYLKWDINRFIYSMQWVLGILFIMYGSYIFGWPGGMQIYISFFVVMMMPSPKAAALTSLNRFLGAFLGGCCALFTIAIIFPLLTGVWGLSLVILFFYTVFTWISTGTSRFAPMGLQMGVCYLLTAVSGSHMNSTILPAIERCAGVFVGMIIATVIIHLVPPLGTLSPSSASKNNA